MSIRGFVFAKKICFVIELLWTIFAEWKIKLNLEHVSFGEKQTNNSLQSANVLSLAFVGDAVWSVLVREYFFEHSSLKNGKLHLLTTKFVKATFQSQAFDKIESMLLPQELQVARHARNAKLSTVAKNASIADYRKATSFEAVLGMLFVTKNFERIEQIFKIFVLEFEDSLTKLRR